MNTAQLTALLHLASCKSTGVAFGVVKSCTTLLYGFDSEIHNRPDTQKLTLALALLLTAANTAQRYKFAKSSTGNFRQEFLPTPISTILGIISLVSMFSCNYRTGDGIADTLQQMPQSALILGGTAAAAVGAGLYFRKDKIAKYARANIYGVEKLAQIWWPSIIPVCFIAFSIDLLIYMLAKLHDDQHADQLIKARPYVGSLCLALIAANTMRVANLYKQSQAEAEVAEPLLDSHTQFKQKRDSISNAALWLYFILYSATGMALTAQYAGMKDCATSINMAITATAAGLIFKLEHDVNKRVTESFSRDIQETVSARATV